MLMVYSAALKTKCTWIPLTCKSRIVYRGHRRYNLQIPILFNVLFSNRQCKSALCKCEKSIVMSFKLQSLFVSSSFFLQEWSLFFIITIMTLMCQSIYFLQSLFLSLSFFFLKNNFYFFYHHHHDPNVPNHLDFENISTIFELYRRLTISTMLTRNCLPSIQFGWIFLQPNTWQLNRSLYIFSYMTFLMSHVNFFLNNTCW